MNDQRPRSETFGGKLRSGRLGKKLTQEATATAVGVKQSTVSAWESGDAYPTAGNLVRLADLYGLDEGELLRLMVAETGAGVPA